MVVDRPGEEIGREGDPNPRAQTLWLATLEYGPFVVAVVLLLLTSLADLMPSTERLFPESRVGVYVGITFVALFAFVLRLSDRLKSLEILAKESRDLQGEIAATARHTIELVPLVHAFRIAEGTARDSETVRVYAFSSRFISAHMLPREFSARKIHLLTTGAGTDDEMTNTQIGLETTNTEIGLSILYTWAGGIRSGNIAEINMHQHDFYPTEWYVIFDDRMMVLGSYVFDEHSVGRVGTTSEAFIVSPYADGASLIQTKIEAFDRLFAATETKFGVGQYEGTYELREGTVKRRRLGSEAWEELSAASQSFPGNPDV